MKLYENLSSWLKAYLTSDSETFKSLLKSQLMKTNLLRDLQLLILLTIGVWIAAFVYLIVDDTNVKWYKSPPPITDSGIRIVEDKEVDFDKIENGIHVQTGLVYDEGFEIVRAACTACHSAKLVTQNRATEEGWRQMIRWMQETQGLWDLGADEPAILKYLSTHYAPEDTGRRKNLDVAAIEWYILEIEKDAK